MKKVVITLFLALITHLSFSQLSINALATNYSINFDATVSGVNNGELGFASSSTLLSASAPPTAGQLDREAWNIVALATTASDAGTFPNTTLVTGGQRSNGGVTGGFAYAFNTASIGTNRALGFQPTATAFTPGLITLRVKNNTSFTPNEVTISYKIFVRNDQPRANSLDFYFSENNTTYTKVVEADYTSPETATGTAWIQVDRTFKVYPQNFTPGSFVYLRWYTDDISGTGSRDEFAIDDITVNAKVISVINYYSKSSGDLNNVATWGTNLDGSGSQPTNFTTDYQIFNIVNRTTTAATISNNWTVSGAGVKVVLAENNKILFPTAAKLIGTLELEQNTFVEIQNPTADYPTMVGSLSTATITLSGTGIQNIPAGFSCKNLILKNGFKVFPGGTVTVSGDMTWDNANLDFAGSSPFSTLNLAGDFTMNGTITYGHTRDINWIINSGSTTKNYTNNGAVGNYIQAFNFRHQQPSATIHLSGMGISIRGTAFEVQGTINATGDSKITFLPNANSATVSGGGTAHLMNVECNKVGGGVTFSSGASAVATQVRGTLSVLAGNLTTNGNITLTSNATHNGRIGTLGNGVTINGNFTVQRYLPTSVGARWFYVGTPVKNQTLGDILAATNFAPSYTYSPITAVDKGWVAANAATPLQPGKGLIGFTSGDKTFSNTGLPIIGDGLDATHNSGEAFDFSIVFSEDGWINEAGFKGWNLLANPYPSAIDWTSSAWTKTNVQDVYWMWDGTGYKFYQSDVIRTDASITKNIPIGQGFFVRATTASPFLSVTEAAKSDETPSFFSQSVANLLRVRIKNNDNDLSDAAFIRFNENSTSSFDNHYDIPKLAGSVLNIAALQENGVELSLHTLPQNTATTIVPLHINSTQNGSYTFHLSGLSSFPAGTMCFLVDKYLNTITDVTLQEFYTFDITNDAASQGKNRFEIVFGPMAVTSLDNTQKNNLQLNIYPNPTRELIWVSTNNNQIIEQLQLIDLTGKLMIEQRHVARNTALNVENLPAGVYILRANTAQGITTKRIVKE